MEQIYVDVIKREPRFVAEDGTQFVEEAQCRQYENTCEAVINAEFMKAHSKEYDKLGLSTGWMPYSCCSDEESIIPLTAKDANDIELINKWLKIRGACNKDLLSRDDIGRTYLYLKGADGEIYSRTTPEKVLADTKRVLDWLVNGRPKCKDCKYCQRKEIDGGQHPCCTFRDETPTHRIDVYRDVCWHFEERSK